MRNLTFYNSATAIQMLFDWGWTFKGVNINNCSVGIDMTRTAEDKVSLSVGSVTLIDSVFSNTPVGIATAKSANSSPQTANTLIIENVQFNNVPVAVSGAAQAVLLAGAAGSVTVGAWGQGHYYISSNTKPFDLSGTIAPNTRYSGLTAGSDYYERSRPQYEKLSLSSFVSVRDAGAKGDGVTDDSDILNTVIAAAAAAGKIVYFDAGDYLVTKTIYIPAGSKITGESYPVILSSGAFFADMANPQPVVQVGKSGESGTVEWSDMIVSTQGAQAGAILIEWNLATSGTPSGMWDVHTRIGGFAGSKLQVADCPKTPDTPITSANLPLQCIAAFMSMHITSSASGLYMEK
jgi:glucan 1,3-beta-glucosidase